MSGDETVNISPELEALMSEAFELLDVCDTEGALKIAKRLERMRWSGCFEIEALALVQLDKKRKAIKVLERGVKKASGAWMLWSRLGEYRSDLGRFDAALKAFDAGLAQPDGDEVSLRLNRAIVFSRRGDHEAALAEARAVEAGAEKRREEEAELFWRLKGEIADALNSLGRSTELDAFIGPMRDAIMTDAQCAPEKAILAVAYAQSLWADGKKNDASGWLKRSLVLDRRNDSALWLSRERLRDAFEPGGKMISLMVKGRAPASMTVDGEALGFYTTFVVVADSDKQALQFVVEFEPEETRPSLRVAESRITRAKSLEPKGVYETNGYTFFSLSDDDDD